MQRACSVHAVYKVVHAVYHLAQAHPSRVRSLVLRAVCLMRQREITWLFGPRGGAAQLHPGGWRRFSAAAPGRKGMAAAEVELEDEIDEEAGVEA